MSLGGKDFDAPKFIGEDCINFSERMNNDK